MSSWLPIAAILAFTSTAFAQRDYSAVKIKSTRLTDSIFMLEGRGGNIGVSVGVDGVLIVDDRPLPEAALPEVTFDRGLSIHFNGEELRVVHFPKAHTDGDGVVFFTGSNVVHTGDLLFNGRFPYVDLRGGGDVQGYIEAVRSLLKQIPPDARIIPGHGPLAGPEDMKTALEMLETCASLVKESIAAGKTLEEIQAAGVPEKWQSWGQGWMSTDRWLSIVYSSYK